MHDTLISKDIIGAAEEAARKARAEGQQGVVRAVTVEVGDLGHVPADELKDTLQRMKPEWRINIVRKKADSKCSCGYQGEPVIKSHNHGHSVYVCPKCGSVPEIIEGEDTILRSVEVE